MSVIERLAERVARQEEKVAKETEKLETYRSQLQTACIKPLSNANKTVLGHLMKH